MVATASGVIASILAASRMLAMLTRMKEVPHRHLRLPGTIRLRILVYTVACGMVLSVLFDLRRIAALGAMSYLLMDIAIHRGILRHLRSKIDVRPAIVATAIVLDVIILAVATVAWTGDRPAGLARVRRRRRFPQPRRGTHGWRHAASRSEWIHVLEHR